MASGGGRRLVLARCVPRATTAWHRARAPTTGAGGGGASVGSSRSTGAPGAGSRSGAATPTRRRTPTACSWASAIAALELGVAPASRRTRRSCGPRPTWARPCSASGAATCRASTTKPEGRVDGTGRGGARPDRCPGGLGRLVGTSASLHLLASRASRWPGTPTRRRGRSCARGAELARVHQQEAAGAHELVGLLGRDALGDLGRWPGLGDDLLVVVLVVVGGRDAVLEDRVEVGLDVVGVDLVVVVLVVVAAFWPWRARGLLVGLLLVVAPRRDDDLVVVAIVGERRRRPRRSSSSMSSLESSSRSSSSKSSSSIGSSSAMVSSVSSPASPAVRQVGGCGGS